MILSALIISGKYVNNYTQNTQVRYIQAVNSKAIVLTLSMMKFKHIIKETDQERDLVKFISKAVPTLENYSFATKMRILEHFYPKSYRPGEFICKEGNKPDTIMVIMQGE
jgi:hypothetical protein